MEIYIWMLNVQDGSMEIYIWMLNVQDSSMEIYTYKKCLILANFKSFYYLQLISTNKYWSEQLQ